MKGTVVFYNPTKQFGFIQKTGGSRNDCVFFHNSHIANPGTIKVGNHVEFYQINGRKGPRAVSIHVLMDVIP